MSHWFALSLLLGLLSIAQSSACQITIMIRLLQGALKSLLCSLMVAITGRRVPPPSSSRPSHSHYCRTATRLALCDRESLLSAHGEVINHCLLR
ncbi:hypothetical protein V8C86DRAFT_1000244 [Haematococcus lacustris]